MDFKFPESITGGILKVDDGILGLIRSSSWSKTEWKLDRETLVGCFDALREQELDYIYTGLVMLVGDMPAAKEVIVSFAKEINPPFIWEIHGAKIEFKQCSFVPKDEIWHYAPDGNGQQRLHKYKLGAKK